MVDTKIIGPNIWAFTLTVHAADYKKPYDAFLKKVGGNGKIKDLVEKHGKDVYPLVMAQICDQMMGEYLSSVNHFAIGPFSLCYPSPDIDMGWWKSRTLTRQFHYVAAVYPRIRLNWPRINASYYEFTLSDEFLDKQIEALRASFATPETVDVVGRDCHIAACWRLQVDGRDHTLDNYYITPEQLAAMPKLAGKILKLKPQNEAKVTLDDMGADREEVIRNMRIRGEQYDKIINILEEKNTSTIRFQIVNAYKLTPADEETTRDMYFERYTLNGRPEDYTWEEFQEKFKEIFRGRVKSFQDQENFATLASIVWKYNQGSLQNFPMDYVAGILAMQSGQGRTVTAESRNHAELTVISRYIQLCLVSAADEDKRSISDVLESMVKKTKPTKLTMPFKEFLEKTPMNMSIFYGDPRQRT